MRDVTAENSKIITRRLIIVSQLKSLYPIARKETLYYITYIGIREINASGTKINISTLYFISQMLGITSHFDFYFFVLFITYFLNICSNYITGDIVTQTDEKGKKWLLLYIIIFFFKM